jgi:AcrR family transcriptional regulator
MSDTTRAERLRRASQERRDQQRSDVRQAMLDAAEALFLEQGYQGFSMRQVAERIGYSATALYLHFANKDDLLFTVADEGFVRFGDQLRAAAAPATDPLQRLEQLGRAYVAFGLANPTSYRLMFIERADFLLGCRAGEDTPRVSTLGIVEQTIREGIATGALGPGDPAVLADALWTAVHGVVALHIAMPVFDKPRASAAAEAALRLIISGLRPH